MARHQQIQGIKTKLMDDGKIIYKLETKSEEKIDVLLKAKLTEVLEKVKQEFRNEFEITSDDFDGAEDDWSHEIKIRKGNKIGVEIDFKWEKSNPSLLELDVDEGSKLGNRILYGCLFGVSIIGAIMGSNDIFPLAFLPGSYKLAAGLGGVIGLIPGGILGYSLKSFFLKNEKLENEALIVKVRSLLKQNI